MSQGNLEPLVLRGFLNKYGVYYESARLFLSDIKKGELSGENNGNDPPGTGKDR